ncbi:hypothetical protein WDJ51_00985 [Rathayibacter sp. YIM 133350]|uniref:hypothetical protein n=1 Tax=Rathayibacter sp. YIM 133350 TaxID=3131992 RepID=UPI00307F667A
MTDTSGIEYPDAAGYPDGTGTLHEGTDDAERGLDEIDTFADEDEEDVEGV